MHTLESPTTPTTPDARTLANRQNALASTGPVTPEGKQRCALNALKHGAFAKTVLLPGEDRDSYLAVSAHFNNEYDPQTPGQIRFVEILTDTQWRLERVVALQHNLYFMGAFDYLDQVNARFRSPGNPDADEDLDPEIAQAAARVLAFQANSRVFEQLARQEVRLRRLLDRTRASLESTLEDSSSESAAAPASSSASAKPSAARVGSVLSSAVARDSAYPDMPVFEGPMRDIKRRNWINAQKKRARDL